MEKEPVNIFETEWFKDIQAAKPSYMGFVIEEMSKESVDVVMFRSTELQFTGNYAIAPVSNKLFWFDAFETRAEALEFIDTMGWNLVEEYECEPY